ncbi:MAG: hypothetical protein ABSH05_06550 [Bryobacteraceae bacterium]|jgi:hypothetical protein
MLLNRQQPAWYMLVAVLVGALLTLVVLNTAHGGSLDCLLFLPLFCFALLRPPAAAGRPPAEEALICVLDPLLASAASRAPPAF